MLQHGQEKMLNRDILVSHPLRHILSTDQSLIQILADISLGRARYLRPPVKSLLKSILKILLLNAHLLDEPSCQRILLMHQRVEKMLLLNLLIAIFGSNLVKHIDSFNRFLRKLLYIHGCPPFRRPPGLFPYIQ